MLLNAILEEVFDRDVIMEGILIEQLAHKLVYGTCYLDIHLYFKYYYHPTITCVMCYMLYVF